MINIWVNLILGTIYKYIIEDIYSFVLNETRLKNKVNVRIQLVNQSPKTTLQRIKNLQEQIPYINIIPISLKKNQNQILNAKIQILTIEIMINKTKTKEIMSLLKLFGYL